MDPTDEDFFKKYGLGFVNVIGHGGYGVIFEVVSFQYKNKFVIKRIPKKYFVQNEVECMRNIDSNLIVHLFNYYEFDDRVYMLMELCTSPLDKVIFSSKKLSINDINKYSEGVVRSVNVCHQNNVSHGDIKPSNFLIDKYGRVKIADFGLSMSKITQSEKFAGTVAFLPPEVLHLKQFDPFKADIWAIGVTIYLIATSKFPWHSRNKSDLLKEIELGSIDLSILPNDDYKTIVKSCLAYDPNARPTCQELLEFPIFKKSMPSVIENKTFCGNIKMMKGKSTLTMASRMLINNNLIKSRRLSSISVSQVLK